MVGQSTVRPATRTRRRFPVAWLLAGALASDGSAFAARCPEPRTDAPIAGARQDLLTNPCDAPVAMDEMTPTPDAEVAPRPAPERPVLSLDWRGWYVGGGLGLVAGSSSWSANHGGGGASGPRGSVTFSNPIRMSDGTGSYFGGLHAGYNAVLPSDLLLGLEADALFPNTASGTQTFSSQSTGRAQYRDVLLASGTVRGRVGWVLDPWLLYATGGFAWAYDEISRRQLAGTTTVETYEALATGMESGGWCRATDRGAMERTPRVSVQQVRPERRDALRPVADVRLRPEAACGPARPQLPLQRRRGPGAAAERTDGARARPARTARADDLRRAVCSFVSLALSRPEQPHTESGARRPGMSPCMRVCVSGKEPSSGSTRRSIRGSGSATVSVSRDFPAGRRTRSAPVFPMSVCPASFSVR